MATQLTVVNNVLSELREDTVASVSTNVYSKLIGTFVNRAIEKLEDINHSWSVYITEIDTTILADSSTIVYDLTATNDRSILLRDINNDLYPAAYDITSNEVGQLIDCPYSEVLKQRALTNDTTKTVTSPRLFAVISDSDGKGWSLNTVWPVDSADSARSWRTYWYIPTTKLLLDGTDDAVVIKLPAAPLEQWAIYLALNERGEEMGQPGGLAHTAAMDSIGSALERDMVVQKKHAWGAARDWNNDECL